MFESWLPMDSDFFKKATVMLSRVGDAVHTIQEVSLGLMIGLACSVMFFRIRPRPQRLALSLRAIGLISPIVLGVAMFGLLLARNWTPEPLIDAAASKIKNYVLWCG